MLDHDTDAYEKISRAFVDDDPSGGLTRDRVLDNITLYWLTETRTSAGRILRGARKISPGNTVIATGCETSGGVCPLAAAAAVAR